MKAALVADGFSVEEGYPGGTQDILGWPRKGAGEAVLQRALRRFGFRGDVARRTLTHDELDAVACAWTGQLHLSADSLVIGDAAEGTMILPRPAPGWTSPRRSRAAGRFRNGEKRPVRPRGG